MNFNHINRTSLINSLYASRTSLTNNQPEPKYQISQQHHLNPSKSKVNIKQSLNKTIQNYKMNNSVIVQIKNRSYVNNPISTNNKKEDQDKYFRADGSITDRTFNKENKYKSNVSHTNHNNHVNHVNHIDDKRKSQFLYRNQNNNEYRLNFQHKVQQKANQNLPINISQLNSTIHKLLKRMTNTQQQLLKIKQSIQKQSDCGHDDLVQLKTKMNEMIQSSSKRQVQWDIRFKRDIQWDIRFREQLKEINSVKEMINQRENNICKNTIRINKIEDIIKAGQNNSMVMSDSNCHKQIQQNIGNFNVREQIQALKKKIQEVEVNMTKNNKKIFQEISSMNASINQNVNNSMNASINQPISSSMNQPMNALNQPMSSSYSEYRRSSKQSSNSITLQSHQTLKLRYNRQLVKPQVLLIKDKVYYIDTNGYLLDENKYYLLNKNNQQIMIKEHYLDILRQNQIIKN